MLNIIRIFAATAILTAWSHVAAVTAAHIVPIDPPSHAAMAVAADARSCPLRAWPYIG